MNLLTIIASISLLVGGLATYFFFIESHIKDDEFWGYKLIKSPECESCLIVADELLVSFEKDVSKDDINTVIAEIGGEVLEVEIYTNSSVYRVRLSDADTLETARQKLEMDPSVKFVVYHDIIEPSSN